MLPPSNAPSWWDIYSAAATALAGRLKKGFPDIPSHEGMVDEILKPLHTQQLADLIVREFAGDTFMETRRSVDIADCNDNHILITALAHIGVLRGVLTTNFDTLLERAGSLENFSWAVVAPNMGIQAVLDVRPRLIKLHGTAAEHRHLAETSSQKFRELSPELSEA
jgi:NAD-dependent SIR2 family protein deacetylase